MTDQQNENVMSVPITTIQARQILDSRGNPTVEVELLLQDGSWGRAAVPSGASTGSAEAVEIRDGDVTKYGGKSVLQAVANVNGPLFDGLRGFIWDSQRSLDARLCAIDGTENKSRLGANAILGVSLAFARAVAEHRGRPLYETLGAEPVSTLPLPMFNVLNGGVHADNGVDVQEFMIAPCGAKTFSDALRMGVDTYRTLKSVLHQRGYVTSVGDEGGFAPRVRSNEEAIELVLEAITKAGYRAGVEIAIALDPAASELFEGGSYVLRASNGARKTPEQMVEMWSDWVRQYPIASIEDGVAENDRIGWKRMTEVLGSRIQLVGDDNFVTNPRLIREGIADGIANAVLIKLNQIGTVSETFDAIAVAQQAGYGTVISHRSGETSDDFIADLAVASSAGQIKSGAPARGERLAKYNQLLRIEDRLGARARFAGWKPFARTALGRAHEEREGEADGDR